jgi:hypothetical protein
MLRRPTRPKARPPLETLGDSVIMSVPAAGKLMGLGRAAAYGAASRGELPTLRFGRKLVVPVAELQRLLGFAGASKSARHPDQASKEGKQQ